MCAEGNIELTYSNSTQRLTTSMAGRTENQPQGDNVVAKPSTIGDSAGVEGDLSRSVNAAPESNKLVAESQEATKRNTQELVKSGALPDTSFSTELAATSTAAEKPADSKTGDSRPGDSRTGDRADGVGNPADTSTGQRQFESADNPLLKNIADPQGFQEGLQDTAKAMVAAQDNPAEAAKIFDEASAKFSRENPDARGSTFGSFLNDALRDQPGNKLAVFQDSSEGARQGNNNNQLFRNGDNGKSEKIAESNHKFSLGASETEVADIASRLNQRLPQETSLLSNPANVLDIAQAANDLVVANGLGQDTSQIFEKAAADFREKNPNAPAATFARLLSNAMRENPQQSSLMASFADGGGRLEGDGEAMLFDSSLQPGKKKVASVSLNRGQN